MPATTNKLTANDVIIRSEDLKTGDIILKLGNALNFLNDCTSDYGGLLFTATEPGFGRLESTRDGRLLNNRWETKAWRVVVIKRREPEINEWGEVCP